jgi:flagellar biosynthesis protein FlhB
MTQPDLEGRTEDATPRRREQARAEGQVAYSGDLMIGAVCFVVAILMRWHGSTWLAQAAESMRSALSRIRVTDWTIVETQASATWVLEGVAACCLTPLLIVWGMQWAVGFAQVGLHWRTNALELKWDRLSIEQGWSRIASGASIQKLAVTTCKLFLVMGVIGWRVTLDWPVIHSLGRLSMRQGLVNTSLIVSRTALWLGVTMLLVGLVDYALQRWKHERQLKMTREEQKQEAREEQGDPQVRSRQRKLQREARKERGIKDVPQATVVITNPTHLAIALRYSPEMAAPLVIAKGSGRRAERIKQVARQHRILVTENKPVARTLYKHIDVGRAIPPQLYAAVATILAVAYRAKR